MQEIRQNVLEFQVFVFIISTTTWLFIRLKFRFGQFLSFIFGRSPGSTEAGRH